MLFATIQVHDCVIWAGVLLVNMPFVFQGIVQAFFNETGVGKWVRETPVLKQLLIYWGVGAVLVIIGFNMKSDYDNTHQKPLLYQR